MPFYKVRDHQKHLQMVNPHQICQSSLSVAAKHCPFHVSSWHQNKFPTKQAKCLFSPSLQSVEELDEEDFVIQAHSLYCRFRCCSLSNTKSSNSVLSFFLPIHRFILFLWKLALQKLLLLLTYLSWTSYFIHFVYNQMKHLLIWQLKELIKKIKQTWGISSNWICFPFALCVFNNWFYFYSYIREFLSSKLFASCISTELNTFII